MTKTITVTVPATSANLGPGFDCIGTALTLYNQFQFTQLDSAETALKITVTGLEAERVKTDESNLVYQSLLKLYQYLGQTPPCLKIAIDLGVPLARGLGSSATAIIGGLVAGNELAGKPLNETEIMKMAISIEGHPDNVVPSLRGGCRLAASHDKDWKICEIPWHSDIVPILAIPDFELSTAAARKVLPTEYSRADAIFNTAHLGLLVRGLETGKGDWLQVALQDRIHQPYRQALIKGFEAVHTAAVAAGAYGMVISGAGPTLLALSDVSSVSAVKIAMAEAWQQEGVKAEVRSLSVDTQGAVAVSA